MILTPSFCQELRWEFAEARTGGVSARRESDHGDGAHLSAWEAAKGIRLKEEGPQGRASGRERVHLARILWHLFKYRQAFNPEVFKREEEKMQRKKLARLQNTAAGLGLKLVPAQ